MLALTLEFYVDKKKGTKKKNFLVKSVGKGEGGVKTNTFGCELVVTTDLSTVKTLGARFHWPVLPQYSPVAFPSALWTRSRGRSGGEVEAVK